MCQCQCGVQLAISISQQDRSLTMTFHGGDAPERALAFLRAAPIGHPPIYLFDGRQESLLSPPDAISRLVDIYWLQPAG